tara:strand:- start:1354 stop:1716 length:363 start_codon:yes stop_codon:yes gene_type:complete
MAYKPKKQVKEEIKQRLNKEVKKEIKQGLNKEVKKEIEEVEQKINYVYKEREQNLEKKVNSLSQQISELQQLPNAKKHQVISFIKSGIRILGYVFILFNFPVAVVLLVLSEGIGILEELV